MSGIRFGVYDRIADENSKSPCALWLNEASGGNATACMVTPHSTGRFLGGGSPVVGGGLNQFDLYSVPVTSGEPDMTIRIEADGDNLVVRADTSDIAGRYVRV